MKYQGQFSKFAVCSLAVAAWLLACLPASAVVKGQAVVMSVEGDASFTSATGGGGAVTVGTVLHDGDAVMTGASGTVVLDLGQNGGGVKVKPGSSLKIERLEIIADDAADTELYLGKGSIAGNVKKVAAASKYEVRTPTAVAGIRGTGYSVSADGTVVVTSGFVIVTFVINGVASPPVMVTQGMTVSPPTTAGAPVAATTASATQLTQASADTKGLPGGNGPITVTLSSTGGPAVVTAPTEEVKNP